MLRNQITITIIITVSTSHIVNISKLIRSSYKYCFLYCSLWEKKYLLTLCLYVLTLSVVFKKSGNLFQILGATYERLFCLWLVFRNGWLNLNKEVLVVVVFWPAGLNKSFVYKGLKLLKHWKAIELIHCWIGHLLVVNILSQI